MKVVLFQNTERSLLPCMIATGWCRNIYLGILASRHKVRDKVNRASMKAPGPVICPCQHCHFLSRNLTHSPGRSLKVFSRAQFELKSWSCACRWVQLSVVPKREQNVCSAPHVEGSDATTISMCLCDADIGVYLSFQPALEGPSARGIQTMISQEAVHHSKVLADLQATATAPGVCPLPVSRHGISR